MIASAFVIVPRNTTNTLPVPSHDTKPIGSGLWNPSTTTSAHSGALYVNPSPCGAQLKSDCAGYSWDCHCAYWSYAVSTWDAHTAASVCTKLGGKYIGKL